MVKRMQGTRRTFKAVGHVIGIAKLVTRPTPTPSEPGLDEISSVTLF